MAPVRSVLLLACLAAPVAAHGAMYRGPGASVPPGGGLVGPAGPAGAPVATPPVTLGGGNGPSSDLTRWQLWWRGNQAPYVDLKRHVRSAGPASGTEGWFLGDGQKSERNDLAPTVDQVRGKVVPALLAILADESDSDLVTGAMIALAKIGDGGDAKAGRDLEAALSAFLDAPSQEVRETAAVSLGILASPRAIPTLAHLLWDTEEGRDACGKKEVDYRTRAFAAYGLGLTGARSESEFERQMIVGMLRRGLEKDDTRSRDLEVACLIALGLVPLQSLESPGGGDPGEAPPESSRLAQIEYLLGVLRDRRREDMARAQVPVSLARLLVGLPEPHAQRYRDLVAEDLMERLDRDRDPRVLLQSCVLALGQIGTNGDDFLDVRIRRALANVPKRVTEPQMRAFSLIAMGEVGGRFGSGDPTQGIEAAREYLLEQLAWGKNTLEPWAGMACGVLARGLAAQDARHPALESLRRATRRALEDEGSPERVGAHALAAGLAGSQASAPRLMKLLEKELEEEARGQVALALGLLGHREAVDLLREVIERSRFRPELLSQAAIGLGMLGDKDVSNQLVAMLADARSQATQAALSTALGVIGDRTSVDPLLALLQSNVASEKARAFAAVALGSVCDKELLPWNSKIAQGLNYRAAPATLFDPLGGKGILDIL